jgi:hypothetical protein
VEALLCGVVKALGPEEYAGVLKNFDEKAAGLSVEDLKGWLHIHTIRDSAREGDRNGVL